ncbi:hypothetical protein EV421DRAFT_1896022 [Armillaria borealis]|uniref:Uncharacterized protein n=1 Tax=Armillaria borealis TaxID=47425 RepID=A0AA39K922_9AGAR|nr:hypothetical protein EV421DRAFT_1896022 [Armillaria borealis]
MAYPIKTQKGKFIGIFWCILNLGGVVGASVAAGRNWKSTANIIDNETYTGFVVPIPMPVFSFRCSWRIPTRWFVPMEQRLLGPQHPSWKTEIIGLFMTLKTESMIILLLHFLDFQLVLHMPEFSSFNGAIFNIRARGLNLLCPHWSPRPKIHQSSYPNGMDCPLPNGLRRRIPPLLSWWIPRSFLRRWSLRKDKATTPNY